MYGDQDYYQISYPTIYFTNISHEKCVTELLD